MLSQVTLATDCIECKVVSVFGDTHCLKIETESENLERLKKVLKKREKNEIWDDIPLLKKPRKRTKLEICYLRFLCQLTMAAFIFKRFVVARKTVDAPLGKNTKLIITSIGLMEN